MTPRTIWLLSDSLFSCGQEGSGHFWDHNPRFLAGAIEVVGKTRPGKRQLAGAWHKSLSGFEPLDFEKSKWARSPFERHRRTRPASLRIAVIHSTDARRSLCRFQVIYEEVMCRQIDYLYKCGHRGFAQFDNCVNFGRTCYGAGGTHVDFSVDKICSDCVLRAKDPNPDARQNDPVRCPSDQLCSGSPWSLRTRRRLSLDTICCFTAESLRSGFRYLQPLLTLGM